MDAHTIVSEPCRVPLLSPQLAEDHLKLITDILLRSRGYNYDPVPRSDTSEVRLRDINKATNISENYTYHLNELIFQRLKALNILEPAPSSNIKFMFQRAETLNIANKSFVSTNPDYEAIKYILNDWDNTKLTDALDDLDKATEEARDEGFPIPRDVAIRNSEQLVKKIYEVFPSRYEVYPTQDGEIAIDIYNGKDSSVIFLCDSMGEILCLVNINGTGRRGSLFRNRQTS